MDALLPLAAVAVASTATYFCCIRPMRRGHCAMGRTPPRQGEREQRLEDELRAAREELAQLECQQARSTGTVHSS